MSTYFRDQIRITSPIVTTDATQTTILSYPIPAGATILARAVVLGQSSTGVSAAFTKVAGGKNISSVGSLVGSVLDLFSATKDTGALTWSATCSVSGTNLLVQVTGQAATTINWLCYLEADQFVP